MVFYHSQHGTGRNAQHNPIDDTDWDDPLRGRRDRLRDRGEQKAASASLERCDCAPVRDDKDGFQRVAQSRRGLGRSLVTEQALVPGEPGLPLACLSRALR